MSDDLDRWVAQDIRSAIEERFYARVNANARLEELIRDPGFRSRLNRHVGLYSDHGVVHVRDVAHQVLTVLEASQGVLIPRRDTRRLSLMQGYGVLLAYFHDVGMVDFSPEGRAMHPEYAAQLVFDPYADDILDAIWRGNSGNLAWHLSRLHESGDLSDHPRLVLREMLSLSLAHSKSKVPVELLEAPEDLRRAIQHVLSNDLHDQYALQAGADTSPLATPHCGRDAGTVGPSVELRPNRHFLRYYEDAERDSFAWLVADVPALRELREDVLDTLRALRAADALRQRGTVFKTSGQYEVFVDQRSGEAVYALRLGNNSLYLFEADSPISAGEANIASSELDPSGDLRISFHRGSFFNDGATDYAARCAADVIVDIQADVIGSFVRSREILVAEGVKSADEMLILLEETPDNTEFVNLVQEQVSQLNAAVAARVQSVPSLVDCPSSERERYLEAGPLNWSLVQKKELLARMGQVGHRVELVDIDRAFRHVRVATLKAGELLIEAGTSASFIYVPLEEGLRIDPLGGYESFTVQPWMPLGITGVIRGAARNADVVSERRTAVLVVPKSVYLQYWHRMHDRQSFLKAIDGLLVDAEPEARLSQSEREQLLAGSWLLRFLEHGHLMQLARGAHERYYRRGDVVIEEGTVGEGLYVVVSGTLREGHGGDTVTYLDSGSSFGEWAFLAPRPHEAPVTAAEESLVLCVDRVALSRLLEAFPISARLLMEGLARHVQVRLEGMAGKGSA